MKNSDPPSTTGWFAFQASFLRQPSPFTPETAGSIAEALTLTLPQAFDNEDNRRHG
jgi:hypothetical protein